MWCSVEKYVDQINQKTKKDCKLFMKLVVHINNLTPFMLTKTISRVKYL